MLEGVALFVFDGNGQAYLIKEKRSKPFIGKKAGMLSIPMETMKGGESPAEATQRLLREEVGLSVVALYCIGSSYFEPVDHPDGVMYMIHCVRAMCDGSMTVDPQDLEDVAPYGWMHLEDVAKLGDHGRRELPQLVKIVQGG